MTFVETIHQHPEVLTLGALVWIPVTVWTISMIQWMIMGEVDPVFGLVAILGGLGLALVTLHPPEPYISYVGFGSVVGMVLFFPSIRSNLTKRALAKIDLEQLERLHEQVRMRPENKGAKFKIAEMMYRKGYVGQGYAMAESLISDMNADMYPEEHRQFKQWKQSMEGKIYSRPLACPSCGTYNPPGGYRCVRCGAEYLLKVAKGNWMGGHWGVRLLGAWVVVVLGIVGIPTITSLKLPREVTIVAILGLMVTGVYVMLRAFMRGGDLG